MSNYSSKRIGVVFLFGFASIVFCFPFVVELEMQAAVSAVTLQDSYDGKDQVEFEIQKLKNLLESTDTKKRSNAVLSILNHNDKRIAPLLVVLLKERAAHTRREAILALARLNAREAADEVGKLIYDPEPQIWHAAAEYGSRLGYQFKMETIKRFMEGDDFQSHSAAMHMTRNLPETEAVHVLKTFLSHPSNHLRKRTLQRMQHFDAKLLSPFIVEVLSLAKDPDSWVRKAVLPYEKHVELVTIEELKLLANDKSTELQSLALRMLAKKGADIQDRLSARLLHADPKERIAALQLMMQNGKCTEERFNRLLNDADEEVWSATLRFARMARFPTMAPRLREILASSNDHYQRKYAAAALLKMNLQVWPKNKVRNAKGYLFEPAAKLANGDESALRKVVSVIEKLTTGVECVGGFPCDKKLFPKLNVLKGLPVLKNAIGNVEGRRCFGARHPISAERSLVVVDGNLTFRNGISSSIVIATGDVYMHDGTVRNSIVLTQGRFICDGYIDNSIVVVGEDCKFHIEDSSVSQSVLAAGTLYCKGYISDSLFAAKLPHEMLGDDPFNILDVRNSSTFDPEVVYQHLRESPKESMRN